MRVLNDDDVRMGEPRRRLRFAAEAEALFLVACFDDFQRDVAVEHGVVNAKHFAHRAAPDLIDETIFTDLH